LPSLVVNRTWNKCHHCSSPRLLGGDEQ
jgi:hypothetical protein